MPTAAREREHMIDGAQLWPAFYASPAVAAHELFSLMQPERIRICLDRRSVQRNAKTRQAPFPRRSQRRFAHAG